MLRISWGEADGIKQRVVERGLRRQSEGPVRRLCVDAKAIGWGHKHVTIVSCADGGSARVLTVEDGREQRSLNRFWRRLTKGQRAGVETVAMDMCEVYRNSPLKYVPEAEKKIVYDNFHLARHINRAVDEVRRREHLQMHLAGRDTLKGTRQLWLYGLENVPRKWVSRFRQLRQAAIKTA